MMPLIPKITTNIFLQKLPDFSVTNRFYSVKTAKVRQPKIRQFLKKNICGNFMSKGHHVEPENHHSKFVEVLNPFLKI